MIKTWHPMARLSPHVASLLFFHFSITLEKDRRSSLRFCQNLLTICRVRYSLHFKEFCPNCIDTILGFHGWHVYNTGLIPRNPDIPKHHLFYTQSIWPDRPFVLVYLKITNISCLSVCIFIYACIQLHVYVLMCFFYPRISWDVSVAHGRTD